MLAGSDKERMVKMPMPKQVEEAGKRADELHAELYPVEGKTAKEGEAAKEGEEGKEKEGAEATTDVKNKVVEPEPGKETKTPEPTELEKLEHKFSVLQGKYDAEVNDVKRTNEFLTSQLITLKTQNDELNKLYAEVSKKIDGNGTGQETATDGEKPSALVDVSKVLAQEDIDALDEEGISPTILNLIGKLVSKVAATQSEAQTSEIAKDVTVLKEERVLTAEEKFWEKLDTHVSDWESINNMEAFHKWLGERIPGTNFPRQAVLDDAQKRLDAAGVVEILKDFKKAHGIETTAADPPPEKDKKKGLKDVVDPVTFTPSVETGTGEKFFSKADVTKFYSDVAKGVYKNNPELERSKEAEILSASIGGRITA